MKKIVAISVCCAMFLFFVLLSVLYKSNRIVDDNNISQNTSILDEQYYDRNFILSVPPGLYDKPFYLVVSIPSMPNAIIYYTIDGNEPHAEADRFVKRGNNSIKVSGRIPKNGKIKVRDRSGHWRDTILTYHSDSWEKHLNVIPAYDAEILQGTTFRFRGFVDGEPVTEIITATYIIVENANKRFSNMPIISVTAPYEDFLYIYRHANPFEDVARRRIFNYEYFEYGDYGYIRIFNLPGSTNLGGSGTRINAQRTFNVHLSRGNLNGVITHPVFLDLYELRRFRLWNGGNAFHRDHMRDTFAQTASSELNVLISDHNLAIKFINGEFWGFITMREHTSNRQFVSSRTGIDIENIALMDRTWNMALDVDVLVNGESFFIEVFNFFFDEVADGEESIVLALYQEVINFAQTHDMSSDYAKMRLFDEFFCKDNFMDYLIANTFFNNWDWPNNNMRFFRAITPDINSQNPYNDGRWRFILHDMDYAPPPIELHYGFGEYGNNRFPFLYELDSWWTQAWELEFNYVFLVLNNPTFVKQFVGRATYVLDSYFNHDRLLQLHNEFILRYTPLLPEMYNRFAIHGDVEQSIINFHNHAIQLKNFLSTREYYYRKQLDYLIMRVSQY